MPEYKVPKRLETGDSVNVTSLPGTTVVVEATDLDIRDLTSTDVMTVTGGVGQTSDVKVTLDGEPIVFQSNMVEETDFLKTVNYHEIVAHDEVANHVVGVVLGNGNGSVIPTTTFAILTNATVTQPTVNTAMQVVSTSASDDDGNVGANQVTIVYFNSSWEKKTEVITMNGTTPVALSGTDVFRVEKFYINKLGSGVSGAVGTITLNDVATGLVKYAQIDATAAFFERAIHYIEDGYRTTIHGLSLSCPTKGGVLFRLFVTEEDGSGNLVPRARFTIELLQSTFSSQFVLPISVSNPNTKRIAIGVAVKGKASNQIATASMKYIDEVI